MKSSLQLDDVAPYLPRARCPRHATSRRCDLSVVAAWTGVEQAEVALTGAERYLAELYDSRRSLWFCRPRLTLPRHSMRLHRSRGTGPGSGRRPEDWSHTGADRCRRCPGGSCASALAALKVRLGKLALEAPISGLVLERPVHVGEVAMPGAPLLTVADLDNLTLTIYVPEDQLGKVQLGQPVLVTVDAYPDRVFVGTVNFVSSQAEFTPKNVQTKEERVSMVFAVKVKLPNPDRALKPGMPADAYSPRWSSNYGIWGIEMKRGIIALLLLSSVPLWSGAGGGLGDHLTGHTIPG